MEREDAVRPMLALKPCPMCGGAARDEPLHQVVACIDCGTCGPGWGDPYSRADAWNQRWVPETEEPNAQVHGRPAVPCNATLEPRGKQR